MSSPYAFTPYIWPMLASAVFMTGLAAYAWKHRTAPGAAPFALQMLFSALWALFAALEVAAIAEPAKILSYQLGRIMAPPAMAGLLVFALEYARPGQRTTRRTVLALSGLTLLITVLLATNDLHHLFYARLWFDGFVRVERGPLAPAVLGYLLLLPTLAIVIFLRQAWRSRGIYRTQALLLFTGNALPVMAFFFDLAGVNPVAPLSPIILLLNVTGLLFTLAIYRFGMLGVIPIGRDTAVERMADGLLILDAGDRVGDLNPAAQEVLTLTRRSAIGQPALQVFSAHPDLANLIREEVAAGAEVRVNASPPRYYQAHVSPLVDRSGFRLGRLISLKDVTEEKRAQAKTIEQQRALATLAERERLARELHDDIAQVLGYVKIQAQAARDRLAEDKKGAADSDLSRLIAVAQDAHADVREYILGARSATAAGLGLLAALRQYLQRLKEHYGMEVDLRVAADWADDALEPTGEVQVLRIIQEALTNVRKHAQAHSVQVSLEAKDDQAQVIVQDDGGGFEPSLQSNREGQKYGLGFMRERAEAAGGSFTIHSGPGFGTRIVVCVPRRKPLPGTRSNHEPFARG
ncbi:MAG: histidine kinase [Chloroflexi bacterium]|nr:histidine kinase [Chloroflexota bacterium]